MVKIVVSGSGSFSDYDYFEKKMDEYLSGNGHDFSEIRFATGAGAGTSACARKYAQKKRIGCEVYITIEDLSDTRALIKRNNAMLENADCCILFWNGQSIGTLNMVELLKAKDMPYKIINY